MADNEIVYEVKANTKSAEDSIKKIETTAKDAGGESGGFGSLSKSISGIGVAAAAAGAAIATYLVQQGLSAGIAAAIETESALARMNHALGNMGRLSADSSADFQKFASEIQNTTTVADDAAISYLALATAFTKTNAQSKEVTMAAINMSAALGTSAETAIRQLGASLSGTAGGLAKLVPEIRNLTEEQLKAGKAIELVSQKFGGSAAAAANTYAGRLTQMKNAWGDVLEEIGFFFTKSDALRRAFAFVTDAIRSMTSRLAGFREESGDVFKPILMGIGFFAQGIITVVGPVIEFIINAIGDAIQTVARLSATFVEFFSGNFAGAAELVKGQIADSMDMSDIFSTTGTESAQNFVNGFLESVSASEGIIQESLPESMTGGAGLNLSPEKTAETLESLDLVTFAYVNFFDKVTKKMEDFSKNQDKLKENLKKGLFTTMVNGVQNAMNAVGAALVNGGNAFEAFGKALLSMFGQMATQLGMFYFLLGLATVYNDPARGAGMIAGGLALMVFGGVLSALAGGGGGASAGGATSGGGAEGTTGAVGDSTVAQNETEQRERATNIEVVVQGNVVGDKREFGIMIAESINEAFGNDGIILARGAVS